MSGFGGCVLLHCDMTEAAYAIDVRAAVLPVRSLLAAACETDEERLVSLWRFDQLVATGFRDDDAFALARDTSVDLNLARRMVAELGCPPGLAVRILG
jgi:hypothetical protein